MHTRANDDLHPGASGFYATQILRENLLWEFVLQNYIDINWVRLFNTHKHYKIVCLNSQHTIKLMRLFAKRKAFLAHLAAHFSSQLNLFGERWFLCDNKLVNPSLPCYICQNAPLNTMVTNDQIPKIPFSTNLKQTKFSQKRFAKLTRRRTHNHLNAIRRRPKTWVNLINLMLQPKCVYGTHIDRNCKVSSIFQRLYVCEWQRFWATLYENCHHIFDSMHVESQPTKQKMINNLGLRILSSRS